MSVDRRYRALLIGNAEYPESEGRLTTLEGPPNDLIAMHAALTHADFGLFAPADVEICGERTSHELNSKLESFFRKAESRDVLLFYFSGHGRLDDFGRLRLCAKNTNVDGILSSSVLGEHITEMIECSAAAATVVILDCCHSGAFKSDLDFAAPIAPAVLGKGRYVMAACPARQLVNDAPAPHLLSPFTQHLAAGLTGRVRATSDPDFVTFDDLYTYVLHALTAAGERQPTKKVTGVGDLVLAQLARDRWIASSQAPWVDISTMDDQIELRLSPRPGDGDARVEVVNRRTGEIQVIRLVIQTAQPAVEAPQQPRQMSPQLDDLLTDLTKRLPWIEHVVAVSRDGLPMVTKGWSDAAVGERVAAGLLGMCNGSRGAVRLLGDDTITSLLAEYQKGYLTVLPMAGRGWLGVHSTADADLGVVSYESAQVIWRSTKGEGYADRQWLMDGFADRTPGVESCLVSSVDGFCLVRSSNLGRALADDMSAAMCSFFGSVRAVGRQLETGTPQTALIETRQHYLLCRSFGNSILTAILTPTADLGVCAYEAQMLETLVGTHF